MYNEIYFQYVSKSKISVEFQRPYMQDIYFTDEQIKTTCSSSNINQWHPKKTQHTVIKTETQMGKHELKIITQVRAK